MANKDVDSGNDEPSRDADLRPPNQQKRHDSPLNKPPIPKFERLHIALAVIAIILGLPPFIYYLSAFLGAGGDQKFNWPVGLAYLLQNAFLIVVFGVFTARYYALYRAWRRQHDRLEYRFRRTLAVFSGLFHNLTHMKRDLLSNNNQPARDVAPSSATRTLIAYCDDVKKGLEFLLHDSGYQFNVTIKAIQSQVGGNDFNLVVVARQREMTQSDHHRADDVRKHQLLQNTAFERLLKFRPTVFASDNLLAMHARGDYLNTSQDWGDRYNATMVVPIRKNNVFGEDNFELVGFIGVDTKMDPPGSDLMFCNGHGVPREEIHDFLLGYADSSYAILTRAKVVGTNAIRGPLGHCFINPDNFAFVEELHHEYLKQCRPT